MNLVLIGYRGTGKSTIGALLSEQLGMPYISTDEEIVRRAGMSIPEIVEKNGWPFFRDLESSVLKDLSGAGSTIIDTGGGIIEREENVACLQHNSSVFWLTAQVDTIVERIQSGTQRPALTAGKTFTEEVAEVLERRNPLYQRAAHHRIATDNIPPRQVAESMIEIWQKHLPASA